MQRPQITRTTLLRWLIPLVAIALIYYFQPQADESRYQYEVNRPWSYSLLTAPFDIPIHLDSVSAQSIRDSLDMNFEPVYYRDAEAEKRMIESYSTAISLNKSVHLSQYERSVLLAGMRQVYATGIIDPTELIYKGTAGVRMIADNVATSLPVNYFLSPRQAYARIDSTLNIDALHHAIAETHLAQYLQPNILLDSATTERFRLEAYQSALAPIGVIQQGERIIDRGDIVTPQLYSILSTYEQMADERGADRTTSRYYHALGSIIFITLLIGSLFTYLYIFRRDYYEDLRKLSYVMLVVTLFTIFAYGMSQTFTLGLYIAPFTIVAVIILVFMDSRTAFFTSLITVLLCTTVSRYAWEFSTLQLLGSLMVIISIKELSKRAQLIMAAAIVFVVSSVTYTGMEILQSGSLDSISPRMFGALAINAVLISFAYILIFIVEKIFGFTSRVTLVELSDINHPVLRELSEESPGTFQHSMAVSNLAAAAAARIGANVQLVRAGSLYHDIGKISNTAFFTENQHGVNPHDALTPVQSARIVIGHVSEGLKRADRAKLPQKIKDFIAQHHGRGKARFFYTTYCNEHPGEQVDESLFTYPGPNPQTRETSIVMMADAIEAASRSLTDHSPESIARLVDKIIDAQITEGLHNESTISFRDVKEIKAVFTARLRTMYHSRIAYPEAVKPASDTENAPSTTQPS